MSFVVEDGEILHIKGAWSVRDGRLVVDTGEDCFTFSLEDVVSALMRQPEAIKGKSMHQLGLMLEARDREIRELKMEVARLRTGALPARHIRDLVLTALLQLKSEIGEGPGAATLGKLIKALEAAVGGDVQVPTPPHESKGKEYKPLDHGSRE